MSRKGDYRMAMFDNAILTAKGNELIVESAAGCQIEFTRLVTGSGIYDGTEDMASMTALKNQQQEFPFLRYEKISEKRVLLVAMISNEGLREGYRMTEIGIYGKVRNSDKEVLYSIATAVTGEADFWPPFNGVEPWKMILRYYVTISPDATHCITVDETMTFAEIAAESNRAQEVERLLKREIDNKVDKAAGKGLSTNDFTDDEKNKLENIETGAGVNVQSDWEVTDDNDDAFIKNKPGNLKDASGLGVGKDVLVPAPGADTEDCFLKADGTWQVPQGTKTTITNNYLATEPGTAADAVLAKDLKEGVDGLINNLATLTDNGKIEDFHIGEDGKPYITYKVGADSVSKKLGSSNIKELLADNYNGWNIKSGSKGGTITFNPAVGAFVVYVAPGIGWPSSVKGLQEVVSIGGYGHGGTECRFYTATSTSASITQVSNTIADGFVVHWCNPK